MEKHFKSYPAIEKKPSFMGIALQDILLVTAFFVLLLLVGAALMIFGLFIPIYFAFALGFYVLSLGVLIKVKPKGQPDFFMALISFHFLQPRGVFPANTNLKLLLKPENHVQ